MEWTALVTLAILIEAIITNLKPIWEGEFKVNILFATLLAIVITILTSADIFPLVGLPILVPYVGPILTGIIVSRGANLVYDIWNRSMGFKKEIEEVSQMEEEKLNIDNADYNTEGIDEDTKVEMKNSGEAEG